MTDDLSEFLDTDEGWSEAGEAFPATFQRDVFVFEYANNRYAVAAGQVVGVIPWRRPVPLPRSDPRVQGVIQDRGQIVVVMVHPTGQPRAEEGVDAERIVICESGRGHVGLPATLTVTVGPVRFANEPVAMATVDSDAGALTYLDPGRLVED